jgi:hypothetical protein
MTKEESKIIDRIKNAYASMRNGDLNVKEALEETLNLSQKLNFDKGELHSYSIFEIMYDY